MGWLEPGTWAEGRVVSYREQPSATAKSAAGWIMVTDDGPEVYFRPDQLDAPLADLLKQGQLLYTWVGVKVLYRDNGHHRYTRDTVRFLEGDGQGGARPPTKGAKGAA